MDALSVSAPSPSAEDSQVSLIACAPALFTARSLLANARSFEAPAVSRHRAPLERHHRVCGFGHRGPLAGDDRGHGDAQPFDAADEVATEPLRRPFGQGRDDDLVEASLAHGLVDGFEWLWAACKPLDRSSRGAHQQRQGGVERPVGRLAIADVRDEGARTHTAQLSRVA
jgi:hypothetical protein